MAANDASGHHHHQQVHTNKPGRPALPPRPYPPPPPNKAFLLARARFAGPLVDVQPAPAAAPAPAPTRPVDAAAADAPTPQSTTAANEDDDDHANAFDELRPSVAGAVLNVSGAASSTTCYDDEEAEQPEPAAAGADEVHSVPPQSAADTPINGTNAANTDNDDDDDDEDDAAADDEGGDDDDDDDDDDIDGDDDDASSTIAVRGGVPPNDTVGITASAGIDWRLPVDRTLPPTSIAYTGSSVSLNASPMHRHQLLDTRSSAASVPPSRAQPLYDGDDGDDDDDVYVFQCEQATSTAASGGGGGSTMNRRQVQAMNGSFALERFLATAQQQQQQQHQQEPTATHQPRSADDDLNEQLHQLLAQHSDAGQTARTLYDLSQTPAACAALRQARCIPLCVQLVHAADADPHTRRAARRALQNIVNAAAEAGDGDGADAEALRRGRREQRVLRHIEHVLDYCDDLKLMLYDSGAGGAGGGRRAACDDRDRHPLQAMSNLMKISCSDEEHRQTMSQLGALQAIACVVHYDHAMHDRPPAANADARCVALRRFAASTLTNLTFGDDTNKSILRSNMHYMRSLVGQLADGVDDQLPANVLRNLSWRADARMKCVLHEIGAVTALTRAVMRNAHAEPALRALLPPLWNLSAHSSSNRAEICALDGALGLLCELLRFVGPSRTWTVAENAGGILRNVSSHVAVNAEYRRQLRARNALGVLLQQLDADSEMIVSNACGTLWNLSARGEEDQRFLLDSGAVARLGRLVESRNETIANMSSKALKNLLNCGVMPSSVRAAAAAPSAAYLEGGGAGDEMPLPPLRVTARTAQLLQNGFMQQQRKFYPPSPAVLATQTQQPPPPPPPRRSMAAHTAVGGGHQSDLPPTPPRRNQPLLPAYPVGHRSAAAAATSAAHRTAATTDEPDTDFDDQITDFSLRYSADDVGPDVAKRAAPAQLGTTEAGDDGRGLQEEEEEEEEETPERCTNYAEEGTPGMYESYSSLVECGSLATTIGGMRLVDTSSAASAAVTEPAADADAADDDDDEMPVRYRNIDDDEDTDDPHVDVEPAPAASSAAAAAATPTSPGIDVNIDDGDIGELRDQFPPLLRESCAPSGRTTPGGVSMRGGGGGGSGYAAYDTPMMFSRHSSMGSLSSVEVHEAQLGDDGQLISDYSRLASGALSPSEVPDSPSQMMGGNGAATATATAFPFDPVPARQPLERPPLRGLFADNDSARLADPTEPMRMSSDDDIGTQGVDNELEMAEDEDDEDDEDDDDDSLAGEDGDDLLAACIQMGMKRTTLPAAAVPPKPAADQRTTTSQLAAGADAADRLSPLFFDSADDDDDVERGGVADQPPPDSPASSSDSSFSGGGDLDAEDSTILQLCIQSGMHKRPASAASTIVAAVVRTVNDDNDDDDDDDSVDLSDDPGSDAGDLLAACINMGIKKSAVVVAAAAAAVAEPEATVPLDHAHEAATKPAVDVNHNGNDSDASSDSSSSSAQLDDADPTDVLLLQQCIRQGMQRKADGQSTVGGRVAAVVESPAAAQRTNAGAEELDTSDEDLDIDGDGGDDAILQQAIAIGLSKAGRCGAARPIIGQSQRLPAPELSGERPAAYGLSSSDADGATLAHCIQLGMHGRRAAPTTAAASRQPMHAGGVDAFNGHRTALQHQQHIHHHHLQQQPASAATRVVSAAATLQRVPHHPHHHQPPPLHRQAHQPSSSSSPPLRLNAVAEAERERLLERERRHQLERELAYGTTAAPVYNHSPPVPYAMPPPPPMHSMHHHHQQQHHYHPHQHHQHNPMPLSQTHHHQQPFARHSPAFSTSTPPPPPAPAVVVSGGIVGWPAQTEFECGCCRVGRYRCARHGGLIVGGSLRRRRDDPLPPIPVDAGAATAAATAAAAAPGTPGARRQRRVKKRSSSSSSTTTTTTAMMRQKMQQQQQQQLQQQQSLMMPPAAMFDRNWT